MSFNGPAATLSQTSGEGAPILADAEKQAPQDPTASAVIPARDDLRSLACLSLTLVESAEHLRTCIKSNDLTSASVWGWWYLGFAVALNRYSVRYRANYYKDAPFEANVQAWILFQRWAKLAEESGLTEIDSTNVFTDDALEQIEPFWEGHEIAYRSLYQDGIRLLEAIGDPLEDTERAPFDDAPDPSDNAPAVTLPETTGQTTETAAAATPSERQDRTAELVKFLESRPGRKATLEEITLNIYKARPGSVAIRSRTTRKMAERARTKLERDGASVRLSIEKKTVSLVPASCDAT
jgi:hypothetical protein